MGAITVTHHEMKHAILLFFLLPALATAHLHHRRGLCSERAAAYDEMAAALESSDTQLHRSLNTVQILNANVEELSSLLSTVRTELAEERSTAQELRKKLASQPEVSTSNLPAAPLTRGARGPAVAKLQDALIAAGLMNADHPYIRMGKGMFGPYTWATVANLQRDILKVPPTGVYDSTVRAYLEGLPHATTAAPTVGTPATPASPKPSCCGLCPLVFPVLAFLAFFASKVFTGNCSGCPLAFVAYGLCMLLPNLFKLGAFMLATSIIVYLVSHLAPVALSLFATTLSMPLWSALPLLLISYVLVPKLARRFSPCGFPRGKACALFSLFRSPCKAFSWGCDGSVPLGAVLPSAPLSPGSRGPGVVQLQEVLISANLMQPNEVRRGKGFFGPFTTKAIAAIQRNELDSEATGVFDASVRAHLLQKLGVPFEEAVELPAAPLSRGARGPAVAQLQDALIQAGLMNGSHPYIRFGKGTFGPYTTQTIAAIQREQLRVEPTGQYDEAVRGYLLATLGGVPVEEEGESAALPTKPAAAPTKPAAADLEPSKDSPTPAQANEELEDEEVEEVNQVEQIEVEHTRFEAVAAATDPTATRRLLLLEMGFDEDEVATALHATQGSLDNAAEWLFVAREAKASFPEEWHGLIEDLVEMGFDEASSKDALKRADGALKGAIKALVLMERRERTQQ